MILIKYNANHYHYYLVDSLKHRAPSSVAWFCLLVCPLSGLTYDAINLERVVVSATRTERELHDVPIRTEVITAQELHRTHARSLKEALENVPGLQLREIHGKSGYEATLQGMSSDQLLILIDGMPLAASTGSTVDLSQYSLADISQIEIIKGAASAQYGSSAMGGVINIISRDTKPGVRTLVTFDAGSYGAQNISGQQRDIGQQHANALLEGGGEQWQARLSADVRDHRGFAADRDTWVREGDESRRAQYAGRLSWAPNDNAYLVVDTQRFEESDKQWLPLSLPGRYPNKTEDITRNRFTLSSGWRGDQLRLALKALSERYRSESAKQNRGFPMAFDQRDMALDTDVLSLQLDYPFSVAHHVQLGVDVRQETLTQFKDGVPEVGDVGTVERHTYELFLQDDYFISPRAEVVFGVRIQDDSDFGLHASPKVALKYSLYDRGVSQALLRASVGTGYRVPNLKERYYTFDHRSIGYMVMGNPSLNPETSLSYQTGVWFEWASLHSLDVNVFYNELSDLIQTDEENAAEVDGIAVYSYKNINHAKTYGLETVLTTRLLNRLGATMSHTYTRAANTDTGQKLTRRPEHIARLGLDWQVSNSVEINTRWRYQSRELATSSADVWSPTWNTLDLKFNYQATPQLSLFGGIDNITHRQRDFSSGTDFGPISGRFMYLGVRLRTDLF